MSSEADRASPASENAVRPGEMIAGKYLVEREIGKGGMGVVVAAMHVELDHRVAIKILHRAAAENPDFAQRFVKEARAAAKIKSEHVARVMDVGTLPNGQGYIVMEHLDGEDLAEVLRTRGALPVLEAVDYLLQACQAISAAHAAGVVHRDLKPANLFLARQPDRSLTLKILDFGVSKVTPKTSATPSADDGSVTRTGEVFGSPTYMSPEQLRGSGRVDTRADIWALGVVLYELLVNQPPFWRGAFAEVLASIMRDPAPPLAESLPDAPPELGAVIARCLEKEPGKRFANVAMLARALLPFGPPHAEAAVVKMERLLGAAEVTMDLLPLLDDSPSSIAARPSRAERTPPSLPAAIRNLREPAPTRGAAARIGLTAGVFLAGVAATLLIRQLAGAPPRPDVATAAPAVTASATAASATAAPSASSPPPAPAPNASASASSPPPAPAEVSITISTAPAGTRVYRGDALLGTVPGAVQLPRGAAALTLRFTADGYVPAELSVVPDMDRLLAVGLVRAPRATPSPPAPTTPKDLEPF